MVSVGQQLLEDEVKTRHLKGRDQINKHFVTFWVPTVLCLFENVRSGWWRSVLQMCWMYLAYSSVKERKHLEVEAFSIKSLMPEDLWTYFLRFERERVLQFW